MADMVNLRALLAKIITTLTAKANIASPTFTGSPKSTTVSSATDSSTRIATTAFVQNAISAANSTIGTKETASNASAVSISTSTGTAITSVTLDKGTWVVIGTVRFSSNTSGVRRLNFSTTSGSTSWDVSLAAADAQMSVQITRIITAGSSTTYYLNAWQNSGSTLTCAAETGTIEAVRII